MAGPRTIYFSDQAEADAQRLAEHWQMVNGPGPWQGKPNIAQAVARALRESVERIEAGG